MVKRILSLLAIAALSTQCLLAQFNNPIGRIPDSQLGLSVGGRLGTTVYFGDLVDGGRVKWTTSGYVEKCILSWLSWRAGIDAGQCKGGQNDNIEFSTTFFDVEAFAKVHFLDLIQGYDDSRLFSPYFAVGGGAMFYNCKKEPTSSFDVEAYKKKVGNDDYANLWLYYDEGMQLTPMVSGVLGVRYALNRKLWLTFDVKGDLLFTDKFDGHTGWPTSSTEWTESQKPYDALWTVALGVQYRFHSVTKYQSTSKYSRKSYLQNRRIYERNARRLRRR